MPRHLPALLICALLAPFAHAALTTPAGEPPDTRVPPDRLTSALPKSLVEFKTAEGSLNCLTGLCTAASPSSDADVTNRESSTHRIRLRPTAETLELTCFESASADPMCSIGGLSIAGEKLYVFGDGCMYVRQLQNAYFPVTKKYCQDTHGSLHRVHQALYAVGIENTAVASFDLKSTNTTDSGTCLIPKGTRYTVVAAQVDESDDFSANPIRYLLESSKCTSGWARAEDVGTAQCGQPDASEICFHGD